MRRLALILLLVPAALRAQSRARVVATIADTAFFAEGVDADPRTGELFVGSIRHRTVVSVARDGRLRDLHVERAPHLGAIMGVRVAPDGEHLWVTTNGLPQTAGYRPSDSTIAALLKVRRSDGTVVARFEVPEDPRGHVVGDLTVGPRGDVFVTDSRAPYVYRLRPGADHLERLTHPLFRSLQGAAVSPDGTTLYLADYSRGLLALTLATGDVHQMDEAPVNRSRGVDGIVLTDGAIIGVQNGITPGRIMRFTLDAAAQTIARVDVVTEDRDGEPTIGTIRDGEFVYVANSQWDAYDDAGVRRAGTTLSATRLVAVPLAFTPAASGSARRPARVDHPAGRAPAPATPRRAP